MAIVHPLSRRLSGGRALAVIIVIWVLSTMIAAPSLAHADVYTWHFDDGSTRAVCFIDWPQEQADLMYGFVLSASHASSFCLFIFLCSADF